VLRIVNWLVPRSRGFVIGRPQAHSVWLDGRSRSDASLVPAPITVRPDLVGKRGFRRGIRRRRGLGGRWEVIPGTEQSTPPLARRSPLRVAMVIRDVVHSMMHDCPPRRVAEWQIVWRTGM
jgi:hypothetical protein